MLDQVEVLKGYIVKTLTQWDMKNEERYRDTNMSMFVGSFQRITEGLETLKYDFKQF